MATIAGKIASVRKDGTGFKIGDEWFTLTSGSVPSYAPEWKSNVVVAYSDSIDEKGRPAKFVDSWHAEGATPGPRRANDGDAGASPGVDRPDWDARLEFDKEKHPIITRLAVLNTATAYFGLLPPLPTGPTVAALLAVAAQFEAWAIGKSSSPMIEAAIEMGAEVESLTDDMAAWEREPRTEEQVKELRALLKERDLPESWVREQGFTMPGKQPSRMAAANAILKLRQMVSL